MSLSAFALTAGLGTRLRPFTESIAKPALPFLGVPLALHALRHLEFLPVKQLFLNVHHAPLTIRSLDLSSLKLPPAEFSDETKLILGSGGALAQILPQITEEHILLLNGDEVYLPQNPRAFEDAFLDHRQSGRLATLVTMTHPEVGKTLGGAWTDSRNKVVQFSKTPINNLTGQHYLGYLFLNRRVGKYFHSPVREENILYDTLTAAIKVGEEVACFEEPGHWFETGQTSLFLESSKDLLQLLQSQKQSHAVQEFLWFLDRFQGPQFVVEKEHQALCQQIQDLWTAGQSARTL